MFEIRRNVEFTQAWGCWLALHVGTTVMFIGHRNGSSLRIELLTPLHAFRVSLPKAGGCPCREPAR